MRTRHFLLATSLFLGTAVAAGAPACDRYEPPPTVVIDGIQSGLLFDSKAPLSLSFGQPIDLATFNFKVAAFDTNLEGELGDEDSDPDTELRVLVAHDPVEGDKGGHIEMDPDGSRLRFVTEAALPVGPKLVVLVEPGLAGTGGRVRQNRTRIPFSYAVRCNKGTRAENLKSGVYFVLLEVEQPLGTQIQLFGAIDVDPGSGAFVAQFTNGDRNPDGARCPSPCKAIDRCRLLPTPECVVPSLRAGTADEHTDFLPNAEPPTGYSFAVEGCAVDDGAGSGVVTAPATMVVQSPAVTVEGLTMTAFFAADTAGNVRATGTLNADTVYLGTTKLGLGKGSMTATLIPDDKVPANVPRPTKAPASTADAGAGGGNDAGR
jgi:hypothetical protein